jgi:hypothetical protein
VGAVTITVQDSVNYVRTLIKNQRLNISKYEPGLTSANIVLQRMLGAPFVWRFNRFNFSIPITPGGGTDYQIYLPTLGRMEEMWLEDSAGNVYAIEGRLDRPKSSSSRRPELVAPVYDDNNGNLTFRFDSVPDQAYTFYCDGQQKAPLLQGWSDKFGPLPDEFGYVYHTLFLAEAALIVNDARFEIWRRNGVAALLATQDGLDEQAKAIMFEQMLNVGRTAFRSQMMGKSGSDARTA